MEQQEMMFDYAPFKIETGKIREFAAALGLVDPVYFDESAAMKKGHRGIPAPPTFATVIDFWNERNFYQLFSELLKIDPNDVLHGEQEYEYKCDMIAGDTITGQVHIADKFHKGNKNFYLLETIYKNQKGETVLIGKATLIEVKEAAK
jgi:hypothetical protein